MRGMREIFAVADTSSRNAHSATGSTIADIDGRTGSTNGCADPGFTEVDLQARQQLDSFAESKTHRYPPYFSVDNHKVLICI